MKTLFLMSIILILIALFSYDGSKQGENEEWGLSDDE